MKPSRRFFVFCVVGTLGFLVDLGTLYAVAPLLGWHGGRVVSFIAAATTTWHFNRVYTFKDAPLQTRGGLLRQYLHYLVTMLGGAAVNYLIYAATLYLVAMEHAPALGVALGCIGGLAVNFASARFLVFRSGRDAA